MCDLHGSRKGRRRAWQCAITMFYRRYGWLSLCYHLPAWWRLAFTRRIFTASAAWHTAPASNTSVLCFALTRCARTLAGLRALPPCALCRIARTRTCRWFGATTRRLREQHGFARPWRVLSRRTAWAAADAQAAADGRLPFPYLL